MTDSYYLNLLLNSSLAFARLSVLEKEPSNNQFIIKTANHMFSQIFCRNESEEKQFLLPLSFQNELNASLKEGRNTVAYTTSIGNTAEQIVFGISHSPEGFIDLIQQAVKISHARDDNAKTILNPQQAIDESDANRFRFLFQSMALGVVYENHD